MRQLKIGLLLATLLLPGCHLFRGPWSDASPAAYTDAGFVPVGRLITRGARFVPEGGGYAVIILKRGFPARSHRACLKMLQSMDMRVGPANGRPILMDRTVVYERPVYWPVRVSTARNCPRMLQNYDFDRAMVNLQRIPNWSRLGRGPFVLVRRANGNQAGLFDFSNVVAQDFDDQFAAVVNYMSQRTDVWTPGFYHPATFRQRIRYYILERSGEGPTVFASLVNLNGA